MAGAAASWQVHSTVDEPVDLLVAFAAHYLALGAAEVNLALDRPTEEVVETLRRIDGVRLTLCDGRYWQGMPGGERPASHVRRQILNARRAFASLDADWMFFCDADEYLSADRPVPALLAGAPATAPLLRVGMAERVFLAGEPAFDVFAGRFRLPLVRLDDRPPQPTVPGRILRGLGRRWRALANRLTGAVPSSRRDRLARIYGDKARFLNDAGLLGHGAGKTFTRRGAAVQMGVHYPRPADEPRGESSFLRRPEWRVVLPSARLLHFDALTPLHWLLKHLRSYDNFSLAQGGGAPAMGRQTEARKAQTRAVHAARGDAAALAALVEGLLRLSPAQLAALEAAGLAGAFPLDIAATAARAVPGRSLDLSVTGFDARLRLHHAALIAQTGFAG